jgi:uncharacterized protein (DUF952 family)
VYKICRSAEWDAAVQLGVYRGSADDVRDGFLHLSLPHQLAQTAARHFAGQADLVLVALDPASLGPALRFEPSRGGDLFPHLYGELPTRLARSVRPLPWDGARHRLPDDLAP